MWRDPCDGARDPGHTVLPREEVSAAWDRGCMKFRLGSGDTGGRNHGGGVHGGVAYHGTNRRVWTLSEETHRAGTHLIWLLPALERSLLQKRKCDGGDRRQEAQLGGDPLITWVAVVAENGVGGG